MSERSFRREVEQLRLGAGDTFQGEAILAAPLDAAPSPAVDDEQRARPGLGLDLQLVPAIEDGRVALGEGRLDLVAPFHDLA